MSIEDFDPPSYWYNLSSNNEGSVCKLFLLEERIFLFILIKCGLIREKVVRGEMTTIIQKDQCISFISQYELVNVEINKYKIDVIVVK